MARAAQRLPRVPVAVSAALITMPSWLAADDKHQSQRFGQALHDVTPCCGAKEVSLENSQGSGSPRLALSEVFVHLHLEFSPAAETGSITGLL